jgi:hypothetical protein
MEVKNLSLYPHKKRERERVEICRPTITILVDSLTLILKSPRLSEKKFMEHEINVLVFSVTFVQIIFHSIIYSGS